MIRKHFLFAIFQVKSTLRIIPRLLLCGIIFLAVVSVIGICGNTMLSDDSGRQMDVNIAAVMPADDSAVSVGFQVIKNMDSIKSICRFIAMDKDAALDALARGEISAIIEIPEGFVDDLMYGVNTPATIVIPESAGMETLIFRSMMSAGAKSLATSEAGIYAVSDFLEYYGYDEYITPSQDELYDFYMKYAFNRMYFFKADKVSSTGQTSTAGYYICSGIVLILIMCGAIAIDRFSNRPRAVMESLRTGGISNIYVRICEYAGVVITFFIIMFAALFIVSLTPASGYISLNAHVIAALALIIACTISYIMFLCCVGDGGLISMLCIFGTGIFMMYACGRILPEPYLPDAVNSIGNYLPVKSMCALMESVFYGTGAGRSIFACVIYTIIFVIGSLVATAVKGRDR